MAEIEQRSGLSSNSPHKAAAPDAVASAPAADAWWVLGDEGVSPPRGNLFMPFAEIVKPTSLLQRPFMPFAEQQPEPDDSSEPQGDHWTPHLDGFRKARELIGGMR